MQQNIKISPYACTAGTAVCQKAEMTPSIQIYGALAVVESHLAEGYCQPASQLVERYNCFKESILAHSEDTWA